MYRVIVLQINWRRIIQSGEPIFWLGFSGVEDEMRMDPCKASSSKCSMMLLANRGRIHRGNPEFGSLSDVVHAMETKLLKGLQAEVQQGFQSLRVSPTALRVKALICVVAQPLEHSRITLGLSARWWSPLACRAYSAPRRRRAYIMSAE
ncbi:uncharacterized protein VTP21DRAFT_3064 [Calcarisporiella thermophila]|uniref:uncharacterized protein n=1 Tax=Calcarisporiella thermophila TaxID=911321 RepID=UPI0037429E14